MSVCVLFEVRCPQQQSSFGTSVHFVPVQRGSDRCALVGIPGTVDPRVCPVSLLKYRASLRGVGINQSSVVVANVSPWVLLVVVDC